MKKKILISIASAVLIILVIVGIRSLNSAPVTLSNTLPMYGANSYKQYIANRSPEMKTADETFITDTTKNQTKDEAIKSTVRTGWISIAKSDTDTAMMRFNQAWLLDQDNFNVLWGYGTIYGIKGELQKSADYFDKAIETYSEAKAVTANDYLSLWDDASLSYLNLSDTYLKDSPKKSKMYASKAIKLLTSSLSQTDKLPKNIIPQVMFLLSVAYFNNEDYEKARGQYDMTVKAYPEIKSDTSAVSFEMALKEKGV